MRNLPRVAPIPRAPHVNCPRGTGGTRFLGGKAVDGISPIGPGISRYIIPFINFSHPLKFHPRAVGWTQTQAHFAIMGGFLYKGTRDDPDTSGAIASPYSGP